MSGPVKAVLRFLCRTVCLILVAIGALIGVVAGCAIAALAIVWVQEGQLLLQDKQLLAKGAAWLGGACLFVYVTWRLAKLAGESDDSFRYRKTEQKPGGRSDIVWLLLLFLMLTPGIWGALPGPAMVKLPALAGWLILAFLGLHLQIFLHELGHFTAAWLMRFHLRKMQIGIGPRLWSYSFANGLRFEWRAWSLGGLMIATDPATKNFRLRQFFCVAAGPLSDLMILWAGYKLIASGVLGSDLLDSAGGRVLGLILFWAALSLLGGAIPRTAWLGDRKVWTDGYWLWLLLRASDKRLATLAAQIKWHDALASFQSNERPSWLVWKPLPAAPVNPAASLETFRQQHIRLSSSLLRQAKPY